MLIGTLLYTALMASMCLIPRLQCSMQMDKWVQTEPVAGTDSHQVSPTSSQRGMGYRRGRTYSL